MNEPKPRRLGWERRQEALQYLRTRSSATIGELCATLGASAATVHRDLATLAEQGLIERVHGGARLLDTVDDPPSAAERHRRVSEKELIAERGAALVQDTDVSIFLEASTTVARLAPHLRTLENKVFLTNSPEIALDIISGPSEVLLIGGTLRQRTLATVGPLAVADLASIKVDLAFVGVSSLDEDGLSSMNSVEAETKSAIVKVARRIVALSDADKLGRRALFQVAPLSAIDVLVTDHSAPAEELSRMRQAGLEIVVVDEPPR